jgi:hypothetical protein
VTLTKLTDIGGWEHLVNDEAMLLGRYTGHYVTLCGWTVDPASLTTPPGQPCPACYKSFLA